MAQVGVLQTRPTRQKHRQGALSCAWGRAALGRAKPQQPPIGLRTGAVGGTDGAAAPTPLCVGWCRGWAKPDPAPTGAWKRAAGSPRPGCQRAFQLDTYALSSDSREDGPSPKRKLLDWVTLVADRHAHEERSRLQAGNDKASTSGSREDFRPDVAAGAWVLWTH